MQLVLACLSAESPEVRARRIQDALRHLPDWRSVHGLCWSHGVTPLVYRALGAARAADVELPPDQLALLARTAADIATLNLKLTADLFELLDALEGAGIATIAYKGPSLAVRAYGNLAVRHFSDLDILVRPADITRAGDVLVSLGYVARDPSEGRVSRAVLRWGNHLSFVRDGGTLVELHWQFHKPMFGPNLPLEQVWARARKMDIAGHIVMTLDPADELLVVATHASWHGWSQLSWVCDFCALLAQAQGEQLELALDRAALMGWRRPLLLGFALGHELIGAPTPVPPRNDTQTHGYMQRLARKLADSIGSESRSNFESALLQLQLRGSPAAKVAFALRAVLAPTPSDIAAVRFRGWLFPLYYVVRPVRIALKYRPARAPR